MARTELRCVLFCTCSQQTRCVANSKSMWLHTFSTRNVAGTPGTNDDEKALLVVDQGLHMWSEKKNLPVHVTKRNRHNI